MNKASILFHDEEESRITPRSFHGGHAPSLTLPRTPTQACAPHMLHIATSNQVHVDATSRRAYAAHAGHSLQRQIC